VLPFVMNTGGWLMTESGRQPWIVQGLLKTSQASSPNVSAAQIWLTIVGFVAIFTVLGGVALWLFPARGAQRSARARGGAGRGGGPGLLTRCATIRHSRWSGSS
jgi:cytochrome bd-type quinol oxidase subunit 1